MAITIREELDAWSNTVQIEFTLGSGTAVGDTIILLHADNFYTLGNLNAPGGTAVTDWELKHSLDGGTNDNHCKVWQGRVTTAGAQTVTTSSTLFDNERYAAVFVLSGTPSFDVAASTDSDTTATSHVAPAVDPSDGSNDGLLICLFGSESGQTNYTVPGSMTGYTERDTGFNTFVAASEQLASGSSTGTRTATSSANVNWFAVSVAVRSQASFQGVLDLESSPDNVLLESGDRVVFEGGSGGQSVNLGRPTDVGVARAIAVNKAVTLGRPSDVGVAYTTTWLQPQFINIGRPNDVGVARAVTVTKQVGLGRATEADVARALAVTKATPIGRASDVSLARALTRFKAVSLGRPTSVDLARTLSVSKQLGLGRPVIVGVSYPVVQMLPGIGRPVDVAIARSLTSSKQVALGRALGIAVARSIVTAKAIQLGRPTLPQVAYPLTSQHAVLILRANSLAVSRALSRAKATGLGRPFEVDVARAIGRPLGRPDIEMVAYAISSVDPFAGLEILFALGIHDRLLEGVGAHDRSLVAVAIHDRWLDALGVHDG